MGKKAVFQAVGSIILGSNVAIPMYLDAGGLLPTWPWQYHALIGFVAFALFIGWIIYDKQSHINKLESGRPEITEGNQTGINMVIDEQGSEFKVDVGLYFKNRGAKAAYQFSLKVGSAPANAPNQFKFIEERTSSNRIDANSVRSHKNGISS